MLELSRESVVAEARPSATVIVVRDSSEGPQVLLLRRNPELAHMPNLWVFPGGKVDAADQGSDMVMRARVAAARELQEEAAIQTSVEALIPFSHWLTPLPVKRRFATWFYLLVVDGHCTVQVDDSEIVEHRWMRPCDAHAAFERGALATSPPTLVSLADIADWTAVEAMRAGVIEREPPYFFPKVSKQADGMRFLYPGDAGYEAEDWEAVGPRHRSKMAKNAFTYERSFTWPRR